MKVTAGWVHANKTRNGGWTQQQLAALGITWPPQHGWIGRVLGIEITPEQREAFERDSARVQASR